MTKKYIIELEEHKINTLNTKVHDPKCRTKCLSILSYITKYCNMNDGVYKISYVDFHTKYQYWKKHPKMSLANFKKIITKLSDWGLIFINKMNKTNVYSISQAVAEKVADKIKATDKQYQGVKPAQVETQIYKQDNTIYTNTLLEQTLEFYKTSFKGISGNRHASRKDLVEIAKTLMSMKGILNSHIQANVFKKIYTSKQKINTKGAVSYINTIINDKLEEAAFLHNKLNNQNNKHTGDEAYYNNLEQQLLGWQ